MCICVSSIEPFNHLFLNSVHPIPMIKRLFDSCRLWRSMTAIASCSRLPRASVIGSWTVFRCKVVDNLASPTVRIRSVRRTTLPKLRIGQHLSLCFSSCHHHQITQHPPCHPLPSCYSPSTPSSQQHHRLPTLPISTSGFSVDVQPNP